jgi:aspartyl-tRNA(Asn)/glutamyl-tRNA(Gln) amidotransferase subunit C
MRSHVLSKEEVLKIARLARLELSDEQVEEYRIRLGRVLDYVKELNTVDTPRDAFVRHVPKDAVAFREDASKQFLETTELMNNAPKKENNCFLLPTILDQS